MIKEDGNKENITGHVGMRECTISIQLNLSMLIDLKQYHLLFVQSLLSLVTISRRWVLGPL
jgi:hypothetical protein